MQVKNIVSSPVFEVTPDTSIARVIDLMVGERISGLPVVDASEALVGIVSEGDLMRAPGAVLANSDDPHQSASVASPFSERH